MTRMVVGQCTPLTGSAGLAREVNQLREQNAKLSEQLERANRLIGWMMPYIGSMCPPQDGLHDLNIHCCENTIPKPGDETKGASIRQHAAGARPTGVT